MNNCIKCALLSIVRLGMALLTCTLLLSCSHIVLHSNAGEYGQNKVDNTLRQGVVKRYTNAEVWTLGAAQVGYVETQYCQVDVKDRAPTRGTLIASLEVKAQQLGGNGLVFDSCLLNKNTASCYRYTHCRGMAYLVSN